MLFLSSLFKSPIGVRMTCFRKIYWNKGSFSWDNGLVLIKWGGWCRQCQKECKCGQSSRSCKWCVKRCRWPPFLTLHKSSSSQGQFNRWPCQWVTFGFKRQTKTNHWERFSDLVTLWTIPDKLRNLNHDIEGQWLTVREWPVEHSQFYFHNNLWYKKEPELRII